MNCKLKHLDFNSKQKYYQENITHKCSDAYNSIHIKIVQTM